jgi:hypothetical protein
VNKFKQTGPDFLVYRNTSKYCWIGKSVGGPDTQEENSQVIACPPGAAIRRPGNLLEFMLRNSNQMGVAFKGPEKAVAAELKKFGKNLDTCEALTRHDDGTVEGKFRGWHGFFEDVTSQVSAATEGFISDPEKAMQAGRLAEVVKAKEAELSEKDSIILKLKAEYEALKAKVK